ncbi:VWA domain-containing protein [Pseudooceanicola sp. 216_PA32_1]|uniref:VWA domain-containing protein n=1 Tax=Pseudooceanicola pacificus TaxID=2676438 RepID=A0A844W988_9RHOB|nr:VWA domain-containing protein [Pseudooceanicola pacificus]MWB77403.1 VWA domain-containing protein [Pseudooceanicola pacificus]
MPDQGVRPRAASDPDLSDATRAAFPGDSLTAFAAAHARLAGAGYGAEVPRVFASAARQVAALHGAEAALALGPAASRLAIRARPRVAALFLDTAVAMARKLDAGDFVRWQVLIVALLRPAPEIVLPLLERMEMLVERLGLDMLDAWIATGLRFAASDRERRLAFFRLELPEARRLLERHAGEDTFQSLERGLRACHRALWGHLPPLREALPAGRGGAARRTSFAAGVIRMPASYPGHRGREAALYRAALAHLGAHFAYGHGPFPVGQLKPMQIAVVSLIEDARVETLAMRDMPGLRRLWAPYHIAAPEGVATAPSLFSRLARALFDPDFPIRHGWVDKGVTMFRDHLERIGDPAISRHIGNLLGNDLGQTRVQFNARGHVVQPVYRDDNLGLWDFPEDPAHPPPPQDEMEIDSHDLRRSEATDRPRERRQEAPPDPGQSPETLALSSGDPEAGVTVMHLPEYDAGARIERPEWVTVKEYDPTPGDPRFWQRLQERQGPLLARTEALVRMVDMGRTRRLKRQAEGETLDLDAAIDAAIDHRSGRTPDHRVYEGTSAPERSIAVHLLLDSSRSTEDRVGSQSVLEIERDAAAVFARATDRLGDALAITAFSSNGREDLRTVCVKRFSDDLGMLAGMALSGLTSAYSTRMGAALRLAGHSLARVPRHRRLVLLLTDGEPSDIDVPDREYLITDARRAVQSLSAEGIDCFCIALGPGAGETVGRIFGRTGFVRVERLDTLPEKLTALYLRMSR